MAIGDVSASGGLALQLVSDTSSNISSQAVAGLGDAVNRLAQTGLGYLNSRTDIEKVYNDRTMKSESLALDTQFLDYQKERGVEYAEFSRGRSASPAGMTRDYDAMVAEKEKAFLATVPPRHREEMKNRLAQDRAVRVGSAFSSELTLLDTADTNNLNKGLNTLGSALKGGTVSLEDSQAEWAAMVDKSSLPAEEKKQFTLRGNSTLQGLEFGTIIEQSAMGYGSVGEATGADVVAANLLPQDRGVLNAIAQNEAPNYNIWNGGSTFSSYEDHPAASGKAPGESTAAGRYQFILGTWRAATASYEKKYGVKVPDFSPEWQDRVALHWAETQFNKHYSGKSFRQILADGNPEELLLIRDVLGKQRSDNPKDLEWAGLGHMKDAEFIAIMTGQKGYAGGGTGSATGPNVWTDPRFADLPIDQRQAFANAAAAAADNQKQEMASRIKLERDQFNDRAYNAGFSGNPETYAAMRNSLLWNADAQAKFNSGSEVRQKTEQSTLNIGSLLAAGTPLLAEQGKAFGRWFGQEGFAGIASGDPGAYARLGQAVDKARLFPDGTVDAYRAALGDPNTAGIALDFFARAHSSDPSILKRSGFSQDDITQLQLYSNLAKNSGSAERALELFNKATDVSAITGKSPTQLDNESIKLFTDTYATAHDVVQLFDGYLTSEPDFALNENTGNQLLLDASIAFQDGYKVYGTQEGAEAHMQTALQNSWGISQTRMRETALDGWSLTFYDKLLGGTEEQIGVPYLTGTLMKYPPEKMYETIDGDFSVIYADIGSFATAAGAKDTGAVLMADDTTDKEVRAGKRPTYKVIGRGEFGDAMVLPGRFGGDALQEKIMASVEPAQLKKNALISVSKERENVFEAQRALETLKQSGADPATVDVTQQAVDKAKQVRDAAILAARENGYLATDVNDSVEETDLQIADLAVGFESRLASDQQLMQRLNHLVATSKASTPAELEAVTKDAMVQLLSMDMQLPPDLAQKVIEKMLEPKQ